MLPCLPIEILVVTQSDRLSSLPIPNEFWFCFKPNAQRSQRSEQVGSERSLLACSYSPTADSLASSSTAFAIGHWERGDAEL
ncbi:MAG: hypothetical protein V7K64_11835 [Nostoc sp.]|uniref:hypothetical protein n=1 Tax=Nostoc sp. TaxID=1180 RepID=UPI002FEFDA09